MPATVPGGAERSGERGIAEGEDAAILHHQPVARAVGCGGYPAMGSFRWMAPVDP